MISQNRYSVLIVEDEVVLAMAIENRLKKFGLDTITIANDANDAIIKAENCFPDLAIVDINLNSDKNGIDVANYLWKNFQTPIIFLTSYYNNTFLKQAMESEPYAYLLKPCREEELKVAINTTLHKHEYFFKNRKNLFGRESKSVFIEEDVKFDLTSSQLYKGERVYKLTKTEKKLLEILSKNAGRIVSFDTIFNYIYREDAYDLAKLRMLIYRLKKKLDFNPFENVYEEGYKLKTIEQHAS